MYTSTKGRKIPWVCQRRSLAATTGEGGRAREKERDRDRDRDRERERESERTSESERKGERERGLDVRAHVNLLSHSSCRRPEHETASHLTRGKFEGTSPSSGDFSTLQSVTPHHHPPGLSSMESMDVLDSDGDATVVMGVGLV